MATEEAKVKLNGLKISDGTTTGEEEIPTKVVVPTTNEEEESKEVVVPTRIEEAGRKYCCAKCYHSYGRVTHVALEKRVTLEPNFVLSGGKGREKQLYYTNRNPRINSHSVEAGRLNLPGLIRKFNTVCNFCGEIVGWHFTAKTEKYHTEVYWCATLMDREKVVLLDEEENEVARDCKLESEIPGIIYLMAKKANILLA
ncbi:hypothetical protein MKW92_019766 [Papaver armeniacum]|nr:hypothetical protein MKW92_051606 [Papaver armeniacum]KAI3952056.1 hypothetical protein MKW92_019766 [Papaver armeniacum]